MIVGKILLAYSLCLAIIPHVSAQSYTGIPTLLEERALDRALARLATVEEFSLEPVGWDSHTSQGEKDYRLIMSQNSPVAVSLLEKLYRIGDLQAKCYALMGLKFLAPTTFRKLYAELAKANDEVTTGRGCLIRHEAMQNLPELRRE